MQSMTGFGASELNVASYGKVSVEIRSANHKFLDSVIHLPEGFLSLEDKIKKAIEAKVKRGRITCVISVIGAKGTGLCLNRQLLKNYILMLKGLKKEFRIKDEPNIDTLIHLPGVLSLEENRLSKQGLWPRLSIVLKRALDQLGKTRQKEGRTLLNYLRLRHEVLARDIEAIKKRCQKASKEKLAQLASDEERSSFLKESDISEEISRLEFHIRNFKAKLKKSGPIGKELDFIAQEMQREANTLAAKSFDLAISARIVQTKSQIEKVREQVQNVE